MRIITTFILTLLILAFVQVDIMAVPASPTVKTIIQANGTTLEVMLRGDEFFHYEATSDGVPIVKSSNGIYNYARINTNGKLIDTEIKAKDYNIRSQTEKHQLIKLQEETNINVVNQMNVQRSKQAIAHPTHLPKPAKFPRTGSPRSLVILVEYSDIPFQIANPLVAFSNMLNEVGYSDNGGTGSARDYFYDNSMEVFNPQFDVVGPYELPDTRAYYGGNDSNGDKRAPEMIVDAAKAAAADGIDFSIYDTDGDGYVDNVFVYFAGHNEAEYGPKESIWPHRWQIYPTGIYGSQGNYTGSAADVIFNGKRLLDYACSSELKSNSGVQMAGIGTFVHEFSHVLGLPDLYATNNANHHTLDAWSVMDAGTYSNNGRTPSGYSAFERFYLGFHTPDLLIESDLDLTLDPLNESNSSYLISRSNNHNLDINNPNPTEFFLLENLQKTGWDTYLPGDGMLIHRIRYDASKINNNQVNNDPNDMMVDIMEADGITSRSTLAGDPFPGSSNVKNYSFTSATGIAHRQSLSNITKNNGVISFDFEKELVIETNVSSLNFEAQPAKDENKNVNFIFINKTQEELDFEIIGDDAAYFTIKNISILQKTGKLTIQFKPTIAGVFEALLRISSNGAHDDIEIGLFGISEEDNNGSSTAPNAPQVPANIQGIATSHNHFIATWDPVYNADSYNVYVYTKTAEDDDTVILYEDFDLVVNGEPNNNAGSTDISNNLNAFTNLAGWSGSKVFEAGGAIKIGSSSSKGYIETPAVDLSANNGNFQLSFEATAWQNDQPALSIYVNDNHVTLNSNSFLDNTNYIFGQLYINLSGGSSATRIKFEGTQNSKARFFLSKISLTQQGIIQLDEINSSPINTTENTYTITNLDNKKEYYYRVTAINEAGESEKSDEVGPIQLTITSEHPTKFQDNIIIVRNNTLQVHSFIEGEKIQIFTLQGQLLYQGITQAGITQIDLGGTKGFLLVSIGNRIEKIIIR